MDQGKYTPASGDLVPAGEEDDEVGEADANPGDAGVLDAARDVRGGGRRIGQDGGQGDVGGDAEGDPDAAGEKENSLGVEVGAADLLFEGREFHSFFDGEHALAVYQDAALMREPLAEADEGEERGQGEYGFHFRSFLALILAGGGGGCKRRIAAGSGTVVDSCDAGKNAGMASLEACCTMQPE